MGYFDADYVAKGGFGWQGQEAVDNKLNDVFVIAESLGFFVKRHEKILVNEQEKEVLRKIETFGEHEFFATYQDKEVKFLELKIFKNGNGHFKFNQEFMKKFNVEASRILGWIKSPKEASREFTGSCKVTEEEANSFYSKVFKLEKNTQLLLN